MSFREFREKRRARSSRYNTVVSVSFCGLGCGRDWELIAEDDIVTVTVHTVVTILARVRHTFHDHRETSVHRILADIFRCKHDGEF